jgi:hypothetical protein
VYDPARPHLFSHVPPNPAMPEVPNSNNEIPNESANVENSKEQQIVRTTFLRTLDIDAV